MPKDVWKVAAGSLMRGFFSSAVYLVRLTLCIHTAPAPQLQLLDVSLVRSFNLFLRRRLRLFSSASGAPEGVSNFFLHLRNCPAFLKKKSACFLISAWKWNVLTWSCIVPRIKSLPWISKDLRFGSLPTRGQFVTASTDALSHLCTLLLLSSRERAARSILPQRASSHSALQATAKPPPLRQILQMFVQQRLGFVSFIFQHLQSRCLPLC